MDDLDRWPKVLPLGTGGFGEVHLAWDTESSEWVALKRFTGQDELGLLRFVIESRIRVSHPHLVRTLAFRLVDDRAWLVTQLARGGSVRALMSRTGALPWGWVVEAVDQVLSALAALHSTGVIHRDLKPANLLLRDGGTVRPHLLVGDFGIATWRTVSMTGIGAAIGTPGYLAPEYLDGKQPAPATDLFAVGVLAAELLAGRRLIHYSNGTPDLPSSWSQELPLPPTVPAQLAAVLRRMADPDPRHRYADCTQAREALLIAAPPDTRADLTSVTAPDILATLPPGWTINGPEPKGETATMGPGWHALPIDGGPTGHVPADAADHQQAAPDNAAQPANSWLAAPDNPGQPGNPWLAAPDHPGQPPAANPWLAAPDNPGQPDNPRHAAPDNPGQSAADDNPWHAEAAPLPAGQPQVSAPPNAAPSNGQSPDAAGQPGTPPAGTAYSPATPPGGTAAHPATPPRGSTKPDPKTKARKKKRKLKRAVLLTAAVLVAASAGAVWWTTNHRTIPGQPSASGSVPDAERRVDWVPILVEPCSKAERGAIRSNGDERCQRTQTTDPQQHWVTKPEGGFPRSNPSGPFPGEECKNDGDTEFTPVGDHLRCADGAWQISS